MSKAVIVLYASTDKSEAALLLVDLTWLPQFLMYEINNLFVEQQPKITRYLSSLSIYFTAELRMVLHNRRLDSFFEESFPTNLNKIDSCNSFRFVDSNCSGWFKICRTFRCHSLISEAFWDRMALFQKVSTVICRNEHLWWAIFGLQRLVPRRWQISHKVVTIHCSCDDVEA